MAADALPHIQIELLYFVCVWSTVLDILIYVIPCLNGAESVDYVKRTALTQKLK